MNPENDECFHRSPYNLRKLPIVDQPKPSPLKITLPETNTQQDSSDSPAHLSTASRPADSLLHTSAVSTSSGSPPVSPTDSEHSFSDFDIMASDSSLIPEKFSGSDSENATCWWQQFMHYATYRGMSDDGQKSALPLLLKDKALDWYQSLSDNEKSTLANLKTAFLTRYGITAQNKWSKLNSFLDHRQGPGESVADYLSYAKHQAKDLDIPDNQLQQIILRSVAQPIRTFILQKEPKTLKELEQAALLAASTLPPESDVPSVQTLISAIDNLEAKIDAKLDSVSKSVSVASNLPRSPSPGPRRVHFERHSSQPPVSTRQQPRPVSYQRSGFNRPGFAPRSFQRTQPFRQSAQLPSTTCNGCGQSHYRSQCFALGLTCHACGIKGHIASVCRSSRRSFSKK